MTHDEMLDNNELFWNDGIEPIFAFWNEQTQNKQLMFASQNEATVLQYVLDCPVASDAEKESALLKLKSLHWERYELPDSDQQPLCETGTFLVSVLDWETLSSQRRQQLLSGCGYWPGMWNQVWEDMLTSTQALLALELERITAGYATFRHSAAVEDLRQTTGWEKSCSPNRSSERTSVGDKKTVKHRATSIKRKRAQGSND